MAAEATSEFAGAPTGNDVPDQPEPILHLKIEAYCILCDEKLPKWRTAAERDASRLAELADVVCFFRLPEPTTPTEASDAESQSSASDPWRMKAVRLKYGVRRWAEDDTQLQQLIRQGGLQVCQQDHFCDACDRDSPANFVHVACYNVAKQILPNLRMVDLWMFARLTRPISLEDFLPPSPPAIAPRSVGHFLRQPLNGDTELGQLVARIQNRLPVELAMKILHRPDRLFTSLAKCVETVCSHRQFFCRQRSPEGQPLSPPPLEAFENPRTMGITTVTIMGEACINEIGIEDGRLWDRRIQLSTDTTTIAGIQTAYGTFGAMAVRCLYEDGSLSPWLGELPRRQRRFQTTRGRLERVCTTSDGFKCTLIGIPPEEELGDPRSALMWNEDIHIKRGYTYTLLDSREFSVDEMGHFGFRTGLCLSLEGIRSLTFYCGPRGISSIQSEGAELRRCGLKTDNQVTQTFFFAPEEYIETVWMIKERTYIMAHQRLDWGPHLLLVTSTGRYLYSGPQELLGSRRIEISRFDQFSEQQRPPVALFVDPSTSLCRAIRSFGAVFEGESGNERTEYAREDKINFRAIKRFANRPPFLYDETRNTFLTTANLDSVTCLKKQMRLGRCIGLYIEHDPSEDSPLVLGQWNPAQAGISTIYSADGGESKPLEELTFVFSRETMPGSRNHYCTDVMVGRHESITERKFIFGPFPQTLAWWFNRRCDFIQTWTGSMTVLDPTVGTETRAVRVS